MGAHQPVLLRETEPAPRHEQHLRIDVDHIDALDRPGIVVGE
jgi:hypothetical protein